MKGPAFVPTQKPQPQPDTTFRSPVREEMKVMTTVFSSHPVNKDSSDEENTSTKTIHKSLVTHRAKIAENANTPPNPVSTTNKQSMGYVTVRNIESETSYLENSWSLFVLKELEDNAFDWLNDYYPANGIKDREIRKIAVRIWVTKAQDIDTEFIHIAVRNSNVNNIPAFQDLDKTFDFYVWHSTKRNQHRMTTGSLGDALKRCLGMGYATWTSGYNPDEAFDERQWDEPVIITVNQLEFGVFINVDTALEQLSAKIEQTKKPMRDVGSDTEVEVTLPIPKSYYDTRYVISKIVEYYKIYKIGKSRTLFSLGLDDEYKNRGTI